MKRVCMSAIGLALLLVVSMSLGGCVSSGEGEKMWKEINSLKETQKTMQQDREQLAETLERSKQEIDSLNTIIKEARDLLSRNNADLGAEMIEVRKAIDTMTGRLENLQREHEKLVKEFDLFVQDVDSRLGGASGSLPSDKEDLWAEAEKRYSANNWVAARVAYLQFARQNKDDGRTDNAFYQVGETYLSQGRYADAIVEFRKVVEFPRSDVADAAIYRSADALAAMGRCDNAKALYESFVADYPRSKYRRDAIRKIRNIKKTGTCK